MGFANCNGEEDSPLVAEAKRVPIDPVVYAYTERDVILYNIGVGATAQELHWTYENHGEFGALPTFGVIPQFLASAAIPLDWLPNFNPVGLAPFLCFASSTCLRQVKLLHGEQFLAIKAPIPTKGELVNEAR